MAVSVSPRVSVVMATYCSGPGLARAVASLDAQTLADDQFEVVVVDDGSPDDTWDHVQRIASSRANYVVRRIEHSGWPSRPRNIGTQLATGDYVLYMDHDDEVFPEALQRMADRADTERADVLLAKETRYGAASPGWRTWRVARPTTTRPDPVLLQCLTPHKLYRRSFLSEHAVAFPDGRTRLEDYNLNGQVFALGPRVAVLSEHPCYRWIDEGGSARLDSVSPGDYWAAFDASLVAVRAAEDPETRAVLLRRWYSRLVLDRIERLAGSDIPMRDHMRDHAAHVLEPFPVDLDAALPQRRRVVSALYRAGRIEDLAALAATEGRLAPVVQNVTGGWRRGRYRIGVSGVVGFESGTALRAERSRRDGTRRLLPFDLPGLPADALDLTPDLDAACVELSVRSRTTQVEWAVPGEGRVGVRDGVVTFTLETDLDPDACGLAGRLEPDTWDVLLRVDVAGHTRAHRLPAPLEDRERRPGGASAVVAVRKRDTLALVVR